MSFIEPALIIDLTKLNAFDVPCAVDGRGLAVLRDEPAAGLDHEDAEAVELGVGAEADLARPRQLLRDRSELRPRLRVALARQPRVLPRRGVDDEAERREVLRRCVEVPADRVRGLQARVERLDVLQAVERREVARLRVRRDLVVTEVEDVRRVARREALGELLPEIRRDDDVDLDARYLRDHAVAALLTAFVSAGPELPIIAVSVVVLALGRRTEGRAGGDGDCADRRPTENTSR